MPEVTITVRGEHEVRRAPEQAVAHIAVRAEGPDRGAVVERIAALAAPIRDDLADRKAAATLVDWTSQRVAVWSDRPWAGDKRLAVVHYAGVDITATFDDFAALSWWITQVAEREGVEVGYIDWRLTDDTAAALEREAAAHAVQVAVARATAYAVALGLSEVVPEEVADRGLLSPGAPMARGLVAMTGAMDDGAALDFRPDDITVSAGVEARFIAR